MLKLSKKVDYGLMAISHIAYQQEDKIANTKHIAELYNIPPELLAKILQRLAKQGLVVSQNGPKGGYVLAKEPHEITVGEVVKAIEGPIGLVDCYMGNDCRQIGRCSVRQPIQKIQNSITQLLDSITIDEITRLP
jgi:Rrf2 family protein